MDVLPFHKAAEIFPLDEENIDALAEDIADRGQIEPIKVMNGEIIDGRRRWLACRKAEVTPELKEVSPEDPVAYVLSLNLHRRHLNPSQKSMVAARAREIYDEQAKERQKRKPKNSVVENLPQQNHARARDQAGKAVGVSGKLVDYATRVLDKAVPEVVKAVDDGRMAVSTAAILATEPKEVQRREATAPKRRRVYESQEKPKDDDNQEPEEGAKESNGIKGVGVFRAHEAINSLSRIPKNDPLRKRGFQIVTDWIRRNK